MSKMTGYFGKLLSQLPNILKTNGDHQDEKLKAIQTILDGISMSGHTTQNFVSITKKTHGWPQGHPTVQLPKYMGRTKKTIQQEKPIQKSQTWEELKELRIKKLRAEIDFSIDTMVSCHIPMETLRANVEKFKGGNITNCFVKWANITQDQFVLNIVKFGLTMELAEVPECQFVPPLNFSPVETEIIDAEISKLLGKGVIVNTTRELNDYVARIFTWIKKDGNYRMILNLKTFNEFLKFKHCKLESTKDALDLIWEGSFFWTVNLKDAYYSIPIHENYQKYLKLF